MIKAGVDQENEGDRRTNAHTHSRSFDKGHRYILYFSFFPSSPDHARLVFEAMEQGV